MLEDAYALGFLLHEIEDTPKDGVTNELGGYTLTHCLENGKIISRYVYNEYNVDKILLQIN